MVSLAAKKSRFAPVPPSVGGSLKRKHQDNSSDNETAPVGGDLKKRRVTFDPEIDVRILSDDNDKSLELVGEEVRRALEKHAAGEKAAYDTIRGLFNESPTSGSAPSSSLLQKYLIALTNHAPLLDHSCKGLVHAAIDCSWIARNEHFVRSYRNFLRALLSVQPGYLSTVLQMIVGMFLDTPSPDKRQQDDPSIQRVHIQTRIHDFLRFLLRINPMASSFLAPVLASTFPFSNDTAKAHIQYIRNILRVAGYCPEIKGEILSLVTDKLVKIDVQMQVDMEDLDDDMEEKLFTHALNEAEEVEMSDNESVSSDGSEDEDDEEDKQIKEISEVMVKLDTVMDLQFSYYDSIFEKGNLADIDEVFESLLSQFANIVLPTYRSRHTQFLLFHFSQTSSDLIDRFAGCCSHLAFDSQCPQLIRNSANAYLASFIARGAHVSGAVVRDVVDLLCNQLEVLRITHEPACKGPDLRRYSSYYSIAQALLYIYCFRWRDLIATPDGTLPTDQDILDNSGTDFRWHNKLQETLRRNIFCRLNPLKICAPTIVNQFARIAHHLHFMYIYPLMETNKRVRLARNVGNGYLDGLGGRETALSNRKGEDTFLMDAYFPFDPYVLPRSKRWMAQDYVDWKPVPGMPAEPDEDEDDEEEEEGEEEGGAEERDDSESGFEVEGAVEPTSIDDLDDSSTEVSL